MNDVEMFLTNWDHPTENEIKKKLRLRKSSSGNLNYNGSLEGKKGPTLIKENVYFLDCLELGVKPLVKTLIDVLNCITYTSCEGHMNDIFTSERHVGIIPRDAIDCIRIINFFSVIWDKINLIENNYTSIQFGLSKNSLDDRDVCYPVLDLYIYKRPRFHWKDYFSQLDLAAEDLRSLLEQEKKKNKFRSAYFQKFKVILKRKYLSGISKKKFPYDNAIYQKPLLDVHTNNQTDQASRRPHINNYIFQWYDRNTTRLKDKVICHPLCGPGIEALSLKKYDLKKYIGIDHSTLAIKEAKRIFKNQKTYQFVEADLLKFLRLGYKCDILLLSYEAINSFSKKELNGVLKWAKKNLSANGFICGDIRIFNVDALKSSPIIRIIDPPYLIPLKNDCSQILEVINWNNNSNKLSKFYFSIDYNPLSISKVYEYFISLPTEDQFTSILNDYGFVLKKQHKLLSRTASDVKESKSDIFFVAELK